MSAPAIALYTGPPGGVSQLQSEPTCAASTSSSKTISGGLSMLFSSFPLPLLPPTHSHLHRSFNHPGHLLRQFRRQGLANRRRASSPSASAAAFHSATVSDRISSSPVSGSGSDPICHQSYDPICHHLSDSASTPLAAVRSALRRSTPLRTPLPTTMAASSGATTT